MKILFITDLYPVNESEKTTPKTLYNFVQGWKAQGHEVKIIKPNFLLNSFVRKKPFYKTGWYGEIFNVNYFLPFIGNIKQKLNGIKTEDFDIVIAHMPSGILFADKLGCPFIAGIHNSDIEILTKPLYKFHFKPGLLKALKNAKGIACRSFVLQNKLFKLYPEFSYKTFTVPSGVDEKFIVKDATHNIVRKNLKIVTCANFKKRKNIDKLIKACAGLDGISLTVIGDGFKSRSRRLLNPLIAGRPAARCLIGHSKVSLTYLIARLSRTNKQKKLKEIDKNVKFTGHLTNDIVLDIMRDSDIFILPSVGETFGMVYLEAMASGCITVCSEKDGIDGIIKNGINGFTVKPDTDSIRKLILYIKNLDNEKLNEIRLNSLNTIKNYTQSSCCKNYLDNIHKILFR